MPAARGRNRSYGAGDRVSFKVRGPWGRNGAAVAQQVERLICNQQVGSSILSGGFANGRTYLGPCSLTPAAMTHPTVAILSIGNEILLGDVPNSNAQWLCRELTARGAEVRHIAVVRDVEDEIAAEFAHALTYNPLLVVTTGGLGPTDDDRSLAAVARALDRELRFDPVAASMVESFYTRLGDRGRVAKVDLTPARRKMALLPEGGRALANRIGAAPGVLLFHGGTEVVLLPGVPEEMQDIVLGSLAPHLDSLFGPGSYREIERFAGVSDESILAPLLRETSERHPQVYVKSRAELFGRSASFRITLSCRAGDVGEVNRLLAGAQDDLERTLARHGIGLDARADSAADR